MAVGLVAAFTVGSIVSAVSQGWQYGIENINIGQVLIDGAISALSVALAASSIHIIASISFGALTSVGQYALSSHLHNDEITWQGLASSFILGGLAGYLSGSGANSLDTLSDIYTKMNGRAAQGVKALITASQRYGFGSKQYVLINNLYRKAIQDAVNKGVSKAFTNSTLIILSTTIMMPIVQGLFKKGLEIIPI